MRLLFALLVLLAAVSARAQPFPPAVAAVRAADEAALRDALAGGAGPDAADADGATALLWAAHDGRLDAARALVEAGATVDGVRGVIWTDSTRTGYYGSVLAAAAGRGHLEVVRFLAEEAGADLDAAEWNPQSGAFDGWTPIQWAASTGQAAVAAFLAGRGADLAKAPGGSAPPLQIAVEGGHDAAAVALVQAGADVGAAPGYGWAPLHYAARDNRLALTAALLDAGATQALGQNPAWTPLMLAAANGHEAVARLLACAGGDPAVAGQDGATATSLAVQAGHTALAAALTDPGPCEAAEADAHFDLGTRLHAAGLYDAAHAAFAAALPYYDRPGGDPTERAATLRALAFSLFLAGRHDEALPLQRRFVEAVEALGDTTEVAFARHNLGYLLLQLGRLDEAEPALDRALATRRAIYPPEDENLVATLDALRDLHARRAEAALAEGDAFAAWDAYGHALGYADEAHGRESTESMEAMMGLIGMLTALSDALQGSELGMQETMGFDLARTADVFDRLVAFAEANGLGGHPNLASLAHLRDQARIAGLMLGGDEATGERVQLAEGLVAQAEAGDSDLALASALDALGSALDDAGAFDEAEAVYTRLLDLRRALHGPEAIEVAGVHGDLGRLFAHAGRLTDARRAHEHALALAEKVLPPDDPALAGFLDPLASLLDDLGDRQQAEAITERIVALELARYGEASVEAAFRLADLARYRAAEGDLATARAYLEQAIALMEAALEETPSEHGYALLVGLRANLGQYLVSLGEPEEALRLAREALAFGRERFGAESLMYGRTLGGVYASVLFLTGDVDGSAEAEAQGLALLEAHLGPDHIETAEAQLDLGNNRIVQRRFDEAAPLLLAAAATYDRYVRDVLPSLSLAEQRAFLENALTDATDYLVLIAVVRPDVLPEAYGFFGGWKGLLLRGVAQQAAAARLESDPAHAADAARLREVRTGITALVQQAGTMEPAAWTAERDRLTAEKERLERTLAAALPGSALEDPWLEAGSGGLAARLPDGAAFVDVYRHGPRYSAVVTASGGVPALVDLGPAAEIEPAVAAWRDAVVRGRDALAEVHVLGERLWHPVVAALPRGTAALWVSSDAALARLPWTHLAMVYEDTEGLLVAEVPSARALLTLLDAGEPPTDGPVLLVGGVDFDAGVTDGAGARWPTLPDTHTEVVAIASVALLADVTATMLTGAEATPAAVVDALPGAAVAHFATHGFFYGDESTPVAVATRTDLVGAPGGTGADMARSPLAESGLALAGANAGPAGSLSAEELVGLDLSGLRLAVLSACETGRGTEVTGQGVLGLQASVLAAGARGLVMSLWKVPDESTALLMTLFYRNLWQEGRTPAAALREAQFAVAADPRFRAPVHWAAWVLSGDAF